MKQFARKQTPLSLVPSAPEPQRPDTAASLNEFFDDWLSTVSSTLTTNDPKASAKPSATIVFGKRPLTSTDVTRVNRATVRESTDHRHWPPDVVQTFIMAEIIKRKR